MKFKAMNGFAIVEVLEEKSEIIRPSGIVIAGDKKSIRTNAGDEVGVRQKLVVIDAPDENSDLLHKEVIVNLYEMQLFERDEKTYGVVPVKEIKVVFDE
jgi:hypothetical protein